MLKSFLKKEPFVSAQDLGFKNEYVYDVDAPDDFLGDILETEEIYDVEENALTYKKHFKKKQTFRPKPTVTFYSAVKKYEHLK